MEDSNLICTVCGRNRNSLPWSGTFGHYDSCHDHHSCTRPTATKSNCYSSYS